MFHFQIIYLFYLCKTSHRSGYPYDKCFTKEFSRVFRVRHRGIEGHKQTNRRAMRWFLPQKKSHTQVKIGGKTTQVLAHQHHAGSLKVDKSFLWLQNALCSVCIYVKMCSTDITLTYIHKDSLFCVFHQSFIWLLLCCTRTALLFFECLSFQYGWCLHSKGACS